MPNKTANQAPTPGRSQAAPPHVSRRARKSLQQEVAVSTALELARREGAGGLTMRRLGEELDVDPTQLYRLFRDKDELLVAAYDLLIVEVLDKIGPVPADEPWQDALRRMADVIWRCAERNSTISALSFARTTGGPAERRSVDLILSTFARAGLSPAQTVLYYRAFVDAVLSLCGQQAALQTLEPEVRAKDATAWTRIYAQLPQEQYPAARAHINELINIQSRQVYDTVVDAIIAAAGRVQSMV